MALLSGCPSVLPTKGVWYVACGIAFGRPPVLSGGVRYVSLLPEGCLVWGTLQGVLEKHKL